MEGPAGGGNEPSMRRLFGYLLMAALSVAAGVGIVAVVSGDFGATECRVLASLGALAVFAVAAMAGATLAQRTDDPTAPVGVLTVMVSAVALSLALVLIWRSWGGEGYEDHAFSLERMTAVGFTASVALSHISVLLSRRGAEDGAGITALLAGAIGLALGIAALVIAAIVSPDFDFQEGYWRALAVMAILEVLATTLLPIARRLRRS